jgi:hypothetical protein
MGRRKFFRLLLAALVLASPPAPASAIELDLGERVNVALVTPVENGSGFKVWGNKYYPGDVLSAKMEEYMLGKMREIPRLDIRTVRGTDPSLWNTGSSSPHDLFLRIGLEEFQYRKSDTLGSKFQWDISLRLWVYDASGRIVYDKVIEERDKRYYPLYNGDMERGPYYWEDFAKSPYWPAMRHAMDEALRDAVGSYNGYRIIGRVVAKAERVDGSLTVPRKKRDKIYHADIGAEDSVKVGDVLAVTRASAVRTIAPDTPETHFPQVVARVRVIFVKGRDCVVEIVKESKEAPVRLGDALSAPLYGKRDGGAQF